MAAAAALLALSGTAACDWVGDRVAEVSAGELRAAATDPQVKAFYENRQWRAAWSTESEAALIAALQGAAAHGLDPSIFIRIIASAEGDAKRDAELTLAALTYAGALASGALASGAVAPEKVYSVYTLDRPEADVASGLDQALTANNLDAWLNGLAPADEEYRALSTAYLAYRKGADQATAAPIPAGSEIRVGTSDPRTPLIAQRLADGGYLQAAEAPAPDPVFTEAMSEALRSLQRDARQTADGVVREATVQALNEISAHRARQLAVNLERRRWLARNPPATRIDVNTAAAQMVYLRDGRSAWNGRTIAGTRENATPQMGETFKQLVVNPPWTVPTGIAEEEILPKGPGYLEANDMYVDDRGMVVQRPGPKAALGAVKFDMQNPHAIYLHDTPAKAIFQSEARHRSHGCVRVDKAVEFARFLAAEHGQAEAFDTALASGETKVVPLNADVAVRLLYHTAYLDPSGTLVFADDPYRWDDMVATALGLGPARQQGQPPAVVAELGP